MSVKTLMIGSLFAAALSAPALAVECPTPDSAKSLVLNAGPEPSSIAIEGRYLAQLGANKAPGLRVQRQYPNTEMFVIMKVRPGKDDNAVSVLCDYNNHVGTAGRLIIPATLSETVKDCSEASCTGVYLRAEKPGTNPSANGRKQRICFETIQGEVKPSTKCDFTPTFDLTQKKQ